MHQPKRAFTLIELLIVVTIIGILAGMGMVAFLNQQKIARDAQRKADLNIASGALQSYFAVNRAYPLREADKTHPTTTPALSLSCYYFSDSAKASFSLNQNAVQTTYSNWCTAGASSTSVQDWIPELRVGGYLNTLPTDPQQNLSYTSTTTIEYGGAQGVRATSANVFSGVSGHRFYSYSTIMNYQNTQGNSGRFFWLAAYLENENDSETVHNQKTVLFGASEATMNATWPKNAFVITSQN